MTAVDRPDNGQDEGRELLDKATDLVAHNVSPAVGWWRSADAKGEPFDRELLRERYERAARDVLALASARAGTGEQQRERLAQEVSRHGREWGRRWDEELCTQWCLCGWLDSQPISKDSGRLDGAAARWRLHVADELLALLGGPQPDGEAGRG